MNPPPPLLDERSILSRIDAVCAEMEAAERRAGPVRHAFGVAPQNIPLAVPHALELDEQRRIASEEWQEVQEDRYRLFQRTIDPVWSVDVRFAGRATADSKHALAPAELGKSAAAASFNPRGQRSAVAALLDTDAAIKLISTITPATAARLADEIAADATMDENVRLSLAHRLTSQAKAIAERPPPAASSAPSAIFGSQSQPQLRRTMTVGTDSFQNPHQPSMFGGSQADRNVTFNPRASTGSLFGGPAHENPGSLFPVQPTTEPHDMLQFQSDRTFDSAVANSMRRLSSIVQSTKEVVSPTAHPDKARQQAELRREVSKLQAVKELKSLSARASGGQTALVAPPSLRSSHSRLFLPRRTTRAHVSLQNSQFDRQWASTLSLHQTKETPMLWGPGQQQQQQQNRPQPAKQPLKRPKSASVLRSASIAQPVQTSNGGSGNNDASPYYSNQFSPNAADRRYGAAGDDELYDEGGERVVRISPQAQYHGGDGQFSFPPQVDADAASDNGSVRGGGSSAFTPSSRASGSFQRQSSQQRGGAQPRPSSAASYQQHQQQHRGPSANADGATNERLYRHSAIKAAQLAHRMQKAAEDREAAEAAARRSRPEISAYARSLPRLSDEVQFNRIARPTIDRHLMQTYAQATEADAFSFAPKLCENSARILEARGSAAAASAVRS